MPLTSLAADAFGVVTISLVLLLAVLGLLCIYRSVYFWLQIRRGELLQLGYFNGPWITRIAFILVAIWWGLGEIVRLSLLRGKGRLFSNLSWQKGVCNFYIISNLGFAEPSMLLILAILLNSSLRGSGALSKKWNKKTIGFTILYCLPVFLIQMALVFVGPKLNDKDKRKMAKYFTSTCSLTKDGNNNVCTYPLLSTVFLGLFYALLIIYVVYIATRMLSLVINKGLQRRLYWLIASVVLFIPLRVTLLGFSVLPQAGNPAYESIVFLAFVVLLCFTGVTICVLVYFPVADSLVLRDASHIEMERMPYDDYYSAGASLAGNRRSSDDASTKRGSVSFRTMIRDDHLPGGLEEVGSSSGFSTLPLGSPLIPGRPSLMNSF